MMDGGMGGVGLLWLVVNAVLWVVPLYYLAPRAGLNRGLAFLGVIPVLGMVLLWVVALKPWPGDDARA